MKKMAAIMISMIFAAACRTNAITGFENIGDRPVSTKKDAAQVSPDTEADQAFANWQDAYIKIIQNMMDYLADPYEERKRFFTEMPDIYRSDDLQIYLAVHDFDRDDTPELIIGDGFSLGVFTYRNGNIDKIADLYTPELWKIINSVAIRDNRMLLSCAGSDGCGYSNFGYIDGEYLSGSYDEYTPDETTVNGKEASIDEFNSIFSVSDWRELDEIWKEYSLPRMHLKKSTAGKWIIKLDNGDRMEVNHSLDFFRFLK